MKKTIAICLFVLLALPVSASAVTKMYGRDCTGFDGTPADTCTNAMSAISTATTGDWCTVPNVNDRTVSWYQYGTIAAEVYPTAIDDDTVAGTVLGWTLARTPPSIVGNIQFSISDPENLPTHLLRLDKSSIVWYNNTGLTFKITSLRAITDTQNYTFDLFYSGSNTDIDTTNDVLVESSHFVCSLGGTSGWYFTQNSGFENPNIPTSRYLIFSHTSGTAENLHVYLQGYLY